MRHLALLLCCSAALAAGASTASAFDNIAVGDPVTGTLSSSSISLASFISCMGSTLAGPVTTDNGTDAGGAGDITSASFSGCTGPFGTPASVTANNLPWHLSIDGTGATTVSGIDVTQTWGSVTCRYVGSLQLQYDAADWGGTGDAPISGSLTKVSGNSSTCTSPSAVSGTYNIVGPNGVIDL